MTLQTRERVKLMARCIKTLLIVAVGLLIGLGGERIVAQTNQAEQANFERYVPYVYKNHFCYVNGNEAINKRDMILEFKPDGNGIFQVISYNNENEAVAYVYQIREDGLYELAVFSPYIMVSDLRYSAEASDGKESLILPRNLATITTYKSGYNQEIERTIVSRNMELQLGEEVFHQVIKIKEVANNETSYHYYAPDVGLLLVTNEQDEVVEFLE